MAATTNASLLTIGQVAERAGLRTSHIRFYERVGVLPAAERVAGQRRYREDVLHRLSIIDVAQRAGLSLDEIRPLTGPESRSASASRHIRKLADEKLPQIDALITRSQAVKQWLQIARSCDCASVDVCGLFVDPTLMPPADDMGLAIRQVKARGRPLTLDFNTTSTCRLFVYAMTDTEKPSPMCLPTKTDRQPSSSGSASRSILGMAA